MPPKRTSSRESKPTQKAMEAAEAKPDKSAPGTKKPSATEQASAGDVIAGETDDSSVKPASKAPLHIRIKVAGQKPLTTKKVSAGDAIAGATDVLSVKPAARAASKINLTVKEKAPPISEADLMPPPANTTRRPGRKGKNSRSAIQDQNDDAEITTGGSTTTRRLLKPTSRTGYGSKKPTKPSSSTIPSTIDLAAPQDTGPTTDTNDTQETEFSNRPSVKIPLPDILKNLLVDDWENVTKSGLVVPLPSKAPANFIIDSYFEERGGDPAAPGSPDVTILQEFCAGMKVYFQKALPKILLYRFERAQLAEAKLWWEGNQYPAWQGKNVGDCYGGEHLVRLLCMSIQETREFN